MTFEPSFEAAQAQLAAVQPDAYARTRNAIEGAVTRLSPYLTHGMLSLRDVYESVNDRHPLNAEHKLVFELGWRAYWRHVWEHIGDGIHQSLHDGPLPDHAYSPDIPVDVQEARTGIPVIDMAVRELYETGYLHNHARMWLASYLVHLRKVHWHTGAQWMLAHLLDGDLASNHLSWQWVAGTGSNKPYLFNADNVAKYAPSAWYSPGTVLDTTYEALERIAHSTVPTPHPTDTGCSGTGVLPPSQQASPQGFSWQSPNSAITDGRDVWLLHPWSVGRTVTKTHADEVLVAVSLPAAHGAQPWSARRWEFVTGALRAKTEHIWWADTPTLQAALSGARSVRWQTNPHIDAAFAPLLLTLGGRVQTICEAELFAPVQTYCTSFSRWWKHTRLIA